MAQRSFLTPQSAIPTAERARDRQLPAKSTRARRTGRCSDSFSPSIPLPRPEFRSLTWAACALARELPHQIAAVAPPNLLLRQSLNLSSLNAPSGWIADASNNNDKQLACDEPSFLGGIPPGMEKIRAPAARTIQNHKDRRRPVVSVAAISQ